MNKEQAEKVRNDFQYLIGTIVDHLPTKPTIISLSVDKDMLGEYHVRIHASNPHPSIGDAWNEFIEVYCSKVGISYAFP